LSLQIKALSQFALPFPQLPNQLLPKARSISEPLMISVWEDLINQQYNKILESKKCTIEYVSKSI
jgi:hypothetical protein